MSNGSAGIGSVYAEIYGKSVEVHVSQWWSTSCGSGIDLEVGESRVELTDDQAGELAKLLIKAALGWDGKGDVPRVAGSPLADFLASIEKDLAV